MTATIIKFEQTSPIEGVGHSTFLKSRTPETVWVESDDVPVFSSREISSTGLGDVQAVSKQAGVLPAERMYPHVFDENINTGKAIIYLRSALHDANVAIDAFGEPDLGTVGTRLTQIAVTMGKAHALIVLKCINLVLCRQS